MPTLLQVQDPFLATEFEDGHADMSDASDAPCFRVLGGVESHIYIYYSSRYRCWVSDEFVSECEQLLLYCSLSFLVFFVVALEWICVVVGEIFRDL